MGMGMPCKVGGASGVPHVALLLLRRPPVGGEAPFFPFSTVRVEDDLLLVFSFAGRQWRMEGGGGGERRREGGRPPARPLEADGGDRSHGLPLSAREGCRVGAGSLLA